ncbi:MAG: hypothetical protein IIA87_01915 [Nanoarchaeota archaeon]|nr:hypothetical protein [Nanoarchaeota archaeon]
MRANIAYLAAMYSLTVGNEEGARNILLRIIKTVPERYDPEKAGFDRRTICRNDPLKPEKEAFRQYHPRFDHEKMKAMFFDERGKARGDN